MVWASVYLKIILITQLDSILQVFVFHVEIKLKQFPVQRQAV